MAVDVAHRVEMPACNLAHLVHRDNVIMLKPGGHLAFATKPLEPFPMLPERELIQPIRANHLERDDAIGGTLLGSVHFSHAALTDALQQAVVAQHASLPGQLV